MSGVMNGGVVIARFVTPMSVISNRPHFSSDTLNLKRRRSSQASVQRWEIQTNLEPLSGNPSLFLHTVMNGSSVAFDVEMPQLYRTSGATTANSTLATSATALIGASSVNLTNNFGLRVSSGEFIKFTNHNKIYVATTTLNGNGSLSIFPSLVAAVPLSTVVGTGTSAIMRGVYDTSVVKGMIYTDGILMDIGQVTIIEDL